MANRAVVGTAAVAASLYIASEKYTEYLVKKEQKEMEQRKDEILESLIRSTYEEEQQETFQKQRGKGRTAGVAAASLDYGAQVNGISKELLVDIVAEVKKEASTVYRTPSDKQFHLPLLDTDTNIPDEIAFGAALVFGNNAVVANVIKSSIVKIGPENVLARLTNTSSDIIKDVFYRTLRTPTTVGQAEVLMSEISLDALGALANAVIFNDDRTTNPMQARIFAKIKLNSKQEFIALEKCAEAFNVYICPTKYWSNPIVKKKGIVFEYKRYISDAVVPECGDDIWIMNFYGDTFYIPNHKYQEDANSQVTYDLSFILRCSSSGTKFRKVRKDDGSVFLAYQLVAKYIVTHTISKALLLLESFGCDEISLEHLAVRAGYDGGILQRLRKGTADIIHERNGDLFQELSKQLLLSVPAPDCDWNIYWQSVNNHNVPENEKDVDEVVCGYEDEKSAEDAHGQLEREVLIFTKKYKRLLELSYCLVPIQGGRRPSECVPKNSIFELVMEPLFEIPYPFPVQSNIKNLKFDERDRFIKSRELAVPPTYLSAVCLFSLVLIFYWLSYEGMCRIPLVNTSGTTLFTALALSLTATSLGPTISYLDGMLNVRHCCKAGKFDKFWTTIKHLTERLRRGISVWRGKGTPFEIEVTNLTSICIAQQRVWSLRFCYRDYFKALHRKRIEANDLHHLLMSMAEEKGSEVMEGVLPGGILSGEAFLGLEIETSDELTRWTRSDDRVQDEYSSISDKLKANMTRRVVVNKNVLSLMKVTEDRNSKENLGEELVLHSRDTITGTVVATYDDIILVRFDGDTAILPVQSKFCSFVPLSSQEEEDNSDNYDHVEYDDSDVKEILNENKARTALQRARRRRIQQRLEQETKIQRRKKKNIKIRNDDSILTEDKSTTNLSDNDENKKSLPERHRTVRDALKAGGWKLVRMKNHFVYKRKVRSKENNEYSHQTVTLAKTPSDWRAKRNAISTLRRLDDETQGDICCQDEHQGGSMKLCGECHKSKPEEEFSKRQWKMNGGKCKQCVNDGSNDHY